jgi:hypothetical protein
VRFPVTIRHRSGKAKIYRPAGKFNYRLVALADAGTRRMEAFANHGSFPPLIQLPPRRWS